MKTTTNHVGIAAICFLGYALPWGAAVMAQDGTQSKPEPTSLARDLIGTWVLVGAPGNVGEVPAAGGRLKFLTGNNWTITQADPATGVTIFHHGGTYTLTGDEYLETVVYANPNTKSLINQTFRFTMKVEGDTLTQTGKGNPWTEVWKRVTLAGPAAATPAGESALHDSVVEGWGAARNPAGDCSFKATHGTLTITVPGSAAPHDLSPELGSSTAPTVVQPVTGDFVIQVKVDGEFQPGGESTQPGRTGYTGAGLVVFADESNFVRLERATLHHEGGEPQPYTNFEIRVDGELETIGTTGDLPTENQKPTWLRLERKGDELRGAMSQDGENWSYGAPKELRAGAWKQNKILAGVAAISTSRQAFTPHYSEFSLRQGGNPAPEQLEPE